MAEYELVITEELPRRSPPSLVLTAVFAGSEVIGSWRLSCQYQAVETATGAPPPPHPTPPHVASARTSRSTP